MTLPGQKFGAYRSFKPVRGDTANALKMDSKFDQSDGRTDVYYKNNDGIDRLLEKLYAIHRKPRPDLVDLGMLDKPKQYRLRFP